MTQGSTEYLQQKVAAPPSSSNTNPKTTCDVLLNNFQIQKKPHRVLLNCNQIVWERLDAKRNNGTNKGKPEMEQPAAEYGNASNVLHIDEVIRITKGQTKAATFQTTSLQAGEFDVVSASHAGAAGKLPLIPTEQYLTIHFAERIVKSAIDCNRWDVRTLTLFNADAYIIQQWHQVLLHMLKNSSRRRVQRLLVFINPYGGRRQGLQTYERNCKPLFQLAGIDASCIISQRANQIRDMLMSDDLTPFDAVCCVGGDGTVAEVINGLIFRRLLDLGLDTRCPEYIPKPALPIAIIPAGSTDTVAYSLHGTADVRTAAIHLILGQCRGLDICSVHNRSGIVRFCASVLSYGYLGDVAAKSEKYRWMGTKRYEYTGVQAFIMNRGYQAEIRLACQEDDSEYADINSTGSTLNNSSVNGEAAPLDTICYANCLRCDTATTNASACTLQANGPLTVRNEGVDDALPTSSNLPQHAQQNNEDNGSTNPGQQSSLTSDYNNDIKLADCDTNPKVSRMENQFEKQMRELLTKEQKCDSVRRETVEQEATSESDNNRTIDACSSTDNSNRISPKWKVIKGNFFMISGANIACACDKSPNGISRYCHLGDGYLNLILVRKTSLWNNVRYALNTMGRNGDIRNLPFVEVHRTRKVRISTRNMGAPAEDADGADFSISGSCQPIATAYHGNTNNNIANDTMSSWNCDGEVVNDSDITMSAHCQLIDVFMRGPHSYKKPTRSSSATTSCCC